MGAELGRDLQKQRLNSEGPSVSSLGTPSPLTKITATGLPSLKHKPQKEEDDERAWEAGSPG